MKFFIQFFLCGVFTSFLFPPYFLIPIGFIVFSYIFYLFNHKKYLSLNKYHHFLSGFFYGLGFFYIYLGWIKEPFLFDDFARSYSIFSYLLIIYCSLFFGCIFLILKYFTKISIKFFMFPALIILGEFICANLSYGFPWFSFSLIHSGNIFGTSIIFYVGTYGLSYITVLIFLLPTILLFNNLKAQKFLAIFYFITFTLTAFLSNAVVAIILTPLTFVIAPEIGCDPRPFLMAICFGASACFMTPMGYQTNMMVFGPGQYKMKDFIYIGLPLNLIFWALAVWLIPIYWPFF